MLGVTLGLGSAAALLEPTATLAKERSAAEPFGYCMNTSTIRGQGLPIEAEVDLIAKAGYQAIEPWISELDAHVKSGGSLKDLGKRIHDLGLTVESAIGFAEWIVDDVARRQKGLDQAKREMEMVAQIGGKRYAAPPVGATDKRDCDLLKIAGRYGELIKVGLQVGVVPQVELWGFSQTLCRLGEVALVAIECGQSEACMLLDIYHIYKGGSSLSGLPLLNGAGLHVIHLNDYPGEPSRKEITDAQRVFPGDGVAPLGDIFRALRNIGFRGYLSLELFNRDYWQQDALTVAKTGLEKTRTLVQAALAK